MGNYKFYTPPGLADCLIRLLPKRKYNRVIDICCGSWNLLEASREQFGEAVYVGVDVDDKAEETCFNGATFVCGDGRIYALEEKKRYDLVLSNPPFGLLKEEERVFNKDIVQENIVNELINKRYENEMLQANLLLADEGGVLLFILPATFFEGESYLKIRKGLCQRYTVNSIIRLPIETFGSKRIRTYALIMTNSGKQIGDTQFLAASCNKDIWEIETVGAISNVKMQAGEWIRSNIKRDKSSEIKMFRGNLSSIQLGDIGERVFHCSSLLVEGKWIPSIRYCNEKKYLQKAKRVIPGDIIINRIGRFAKYWCVVEQSGFVSDCLIVIRTSNNVKLVEFLIENSTNGRLNIMDRGVAARYITISDIWTLLEEKKYG